MCIRDRPYVTHKEQLIAATIGCKKPLFIPCRLFIICGTVSYTHLAVLITFYGTDFFQLTLGATPDFFNQARGYENYGAIAEFFVNTRYLSLQKPHGYDIETLSTQLKENTSSTQTITETALDQHPNATVEHPNIITIMNEAFSDLQVVGSFQTDTDLSLIHI